MRHNKDFFVIDHINQRPIKFVQPNLSIVPKYKIFWWKPFFVLLYGVPESVLKYSQPSIKEHSWDSQIMFADLSPW